MNGHDRKELVDQLWGAPYCDKPVAQKKCTRALRGQLRTAQVGRHADGSVDPKLWRVANRITCMFEDLDALYDELDRITEQDRVGGVG